MESPLFVKTITFDSGEQFPMLITRSTGIPMFKPTVYLISMKRAKGLAVATLERDLRAIMFLYLWGLKHGVDIEQRFLEGEFLELHEIDSLAQDAWIRADQMLVTPPENTAGKALRQKVARLSGYQAATKKKKSPAVSPTTAGLRLSYVRDYLDWLAHQRLGGMRKRSADFAAMDSARQQMAQAFAARTPSGPKHHTEGAEGFRLGLTHEAQRRLLEVVDPKSSENPWRGAHVRERNRLLVLVLLFLGVRRGEALGVRVDDINFQKNEVTIHRTPDDEMDTRLHKPQTKTRARLLGLSPELARLCRDYVVKYRSKLKTARRHPFLFVETRTGKPLSIVSVSAVFKTLREKVPDLPRDLSPHILRYTWNDRFSEVADDLIRRGVWTIEDEKKARNEAMGWTPESNMAALYARRHTQIKAREALIDLQNAILGIKDEG